MISKNLLKLIRSLESKKGRRKEGLFVAEGPKVVGDLIRHQTPVRLIGTEEWFCDSGWQPRADVDERVSADELRRISFLQHPQQVVGIFRLLDQQLPNDFTGDRCSRQLTLALDGIQDPGNLGTIIRIADWFGISDIVCSSDTADVYNPKVVQATMGSLARVNIFYTNLPSWLRQLPSSLPVYGTLLDGENLYGQPLTSAGIIVMGNEGNGISEEVRRLVSHRLLIPSFHHADEHAESLNVAIATAIVCAEFRRRSS